MDWSKIIQALPLLSPLVVVVLVLGILQFWLIFRYLPNQNLAAAEEREALLKAHTAERDEFRAMIERQQSAFLETLTKERHAHASAMAAAVASNNSLERSIAMLTMAIVGNNHPLSVHVSPNPPGTTTVSTTLTTEGGK